MARSNNGSSDDIVATATTGIVTNPISAAGWLFASATSANGIALLACGNVNTTDGFLFAPYDGNNGKTEIIISGQGTLASSSVIFTAGVWHHYGFDYQFFSSNNETAHVYFDGAVVASIVNGNLGTNAMGAASTPFRIGRWNAGGTISTAGAMRAADVAVWNVVLTAAEVAALAKGARPYQIRNSALTRWWPFDGLASPEPDFGGTRDNMTLTGTSFAFGPPMTMFTPRWPMGGILPAPSPYVLMPQIVM